MMKHGNKWALVILAAVIVPFACAPMDRQMLEPEIGDDTSRSTQVAASANDVSSCVPAGLRTRVEGYYAMNGPRWSWWRTLWGFTPDNPPTPKAPYTTADFVAWKATDPANRAGPMTSAQARAKPWSGWQPVADALACVEENTADPQIAEPQQAEDNTVETSFTISEGDSQVTAEANTCPNLSPHLQKFVGCVDLGDKIEFRSKDDNTVWGDQREQLTGGAWMTVVDDDVAYVSFRSVSTGATSSQNNGNVELDMTCKQWYEAIYTHGLYFGRGNDGVTAKADFAAGSCVTISGGNEADNFNGWASREAWDWIPWSEGSMTYPEVSCTWLRERTIPSSILYGRRQSSDRRKPLEDVKGRICTTWTSSKVWTVDVSRPIHGTFSIQWAQTSPPRAVTHRTSTPGPWTLPDAPCGKPRIADGPQPDNGVIRWAEQVKISLPDGATRFPACP